VHVHVHVQVPPRRERARRTGEHLAAADATQAAFLDEAVVLGGIHPLDEYMV